MIQHNTLRGEDTINGVVFVEEYEHPNDPHRYFINGVIVTGDYFVKRMTEESVVAGKLGLIRAKISKKAAANSTDKSITRVR